MKLFLCQNIFIMRMKFATCLTGAHPFFDNWLVTS